MKFLTIASSTLLVLLLQDAPATVDARLRVSAVNKKTAQDDALLPRVHVVRKLQGVKLDGMGGIPPQDAYPLQLCEGDCDVDSDCDAGLVCFQREPQTNVPGCIGGEDEHSKTDFCIIDPNINAAASPVATPMGEGTPAPTITPVPSPSPTPKPTSAPVAEAATDAPEAEEVEETKVPTPSPTPKTTDAPAATTTLVPVLELEQKGNDQNPSSVYPLGECEADCDNDDECGPGLICFQRDPLDPVPGCLGVDRSQNDYCIRDPNTEPALKPTSAPVADAATDTPGTEEETAVPTPSPTPRTTDAPVAEESTDVPTITPAATTTSVPVLELELKGNNGSPSSVYPLGECEGDCDDDDECGPGLICFQRDSSDPVPGCLGMDRSQNDYCIRDPNAEPTPPPTLSPAPSSNPTSTSSPTSSYQPTLRPTTSASPTASPSDFPSLVPTDFPSVTPTISPAPTISPVPTATPTAAPTIEPLEGIRIKLYWEEGYTWQDETIERQWCMISDYRGFPGTGKCWHGLRTEPCHQDMVYVARCDSDRRQQFNILPMKGGTQYQIGIHGEDRCMQRSEYSLVLETCNVNNPLQRFWMPRGTTDQKRFELSPITLANYCVTQSHHPKSGEVVELQKCSNARNIENQSSFWNVF